MNKALCSFFVIVFATVSIHAAVSKTFQVSNSASTIVIMQGDITRVKADCIVNAANEMLLGGAGVCGAIFNAAGWTALQQACDEYPLLEGIRCPAGSAKLTGSFDLKNRGIQYIIHAVGPDCRVVKKPAQQDALLAGAYETSLALADSVVIKSIAFPFISSAIFAFPKERAARIALETVMQYLHKNPTTSLSTVYFVLFSKEDYDLFCKTGPKCGQGTTVVAPKQIQKLSRYQEFIEYLKSYFA